MATYYNTSRFRVFRDIFLLIFVLFMKEIHGDTVHLMSVTSTPYGASQATTSKFSCLLSFPDTGVLQGVLTGRHVPRGSGDTSFTLPSGFIPSTGANYIDITLPAGANNLAQGVYYCEATNRGLTTRVPVTILAQTRLLQPANGHFTVTANVGEPISLNLEVLSSIPNESIQWEKQPTSSDGAFTFVQNGGTMLSFNSVTVEDAGVYAAYWNSIRYAFLFSLVRLIVRECPTNRWGPPSCNSVCDNCYNGGICDDKTGDCVCRPGFSGANCLTACSTNTFGWNCDHQCIVAVLSSTCAGSVFCMPDPVGCSCMTGFTGQTCQNSCLSGYGANCDQSCHCSTGSCNIFTGVCESGPCAAGYSGTNCQIPDVCPDGYYGTSCTSICPCKCDKNTGSCAEASECLRGFYGVNCENQCHCLNGVACDRETGKCDVDPTTQLCLCEPGYASSTGVNFDNCQQHEGCYSDCTKTCHCKSGVADCYTATGQCLNNGCEDHWIGTSCQTGVVDVSFTKVNINQPISVTCIATLGSSAPAANHVALRYTDSSNTVQLASQTSHVPAGLYSTTTFVGIKLPVDVTLVTCAVTTDNISFATAGITIEYYALPQLTRIPRASSIQSSAVLIEWDAWDSSAGDIGNGPVITYNVYDVQSVLLVGSTVVTDVSQTLYSVSVGNLDPGTTYNYYVTAEREGAGGEGPPSQRFVTFTTLSIATQPPIVDPTSKATSAMVTEKITTMMQDRTSPPDGMSTASGRNTPMRDRTSSGIPAQTTTPATTTGAGGTGDNSTQMQTIIIAVIVMLAVILIFIIILLWFLRKRRNRMKRYPPSIIASEADLDRLSSVIPHGAINVETQSISTLDGIDNLALDLDEKLDPVPRPKSMPPLNMLGAETPPSLRGRPISADAASPGSGPESLKRRLRIQAVNIKDYANYVKGKRQTTDLRVEWDSLPKDVTRPATIARKMENKGKNRYRNVIAYDHSRLVLEPLENDENSDYINACYIKGIKNPKAYIATQGPNEKTIGDYWRLTWQENITVMVMACRVFEEGRPKCAKYWPDKGAPIEYHGITINLESEEQKEEFYLVRKFTMTKEGEEEVREVTQFHYTQWPDKDVPKHCTPVLKFIDVINIKSILLMIVFQGEEEVREVTQFHYTQWPDKDVPKHCTPVLKFIDVIKENHDKKSPLLTHCSAGAGRTGAILAIHAMMELTEEKGQVDIYNFVFSMRNSRPNIVQTSSQYTFVHDAILEYLFCKNTFVEASVFANKLKSLQDQNLETGNTFLEDEYEILTLVSPSLIPERTRGSMKPENTAKVRCIGNLPVDSNRPYLMTPRGDEDLSPYINAAYMDGYKKKDLFISTQMPMSNTVIDLWRMMYDYNCTSIVQLNAMDPDDESCPPFWPDAGTNEYGPFTVSLLDKESTPDFETRTLQLVYTKRDVKSPIPVRHFQYMTWPKGDERPATSDGILQLISAVEKWQKTLEAPGPIVVLCMNAAGRTGTFCTIQNCLDQIREEQGVDVLQNVKLLRIHRTNMVDTPAKYLFCYETILDYLKAFDDYTNSKHYQNQEIPKPVQPEKDQTDSGHLYDNVVRQKKESAKKDKKGSKKERKQDLKSQGASNDGDGKALVDNETKSVPEIKVVPETESEQPPEIKTKSPGIKGKGAEGGGSTKGSSKWGKKSKKKSTKKQDQTYENVMFDTKL